MDPLEHETTDERLWISCTQTREGRAVGRAPKCSARSVRWMKDLADNVADNVASSSSSSSPQPSAIPPIQRASDGGHPVPLPPEGNRAVVQQGIVTVGPQTAYWRPGGVYYWSTASPIEAQRHIAEMSWDERKQRRAVETHEAVQRMQANHARQEALHRAGRSPPPPRLPRVHDFLLHPIADDTMLVEITPSVVWNDGKELVRQRVIAPTERAWAAVGKNDATTRLWQAWAGSVRNGSSAKLLDLMGRVTEDYFRHVEQHRKRVDSDVQSRRSGEKAP